MANEFATLARKLDVDPIEVIRASATKPCGFMPFYPGPGVGEHCIPCDRTTCSGNSAHHTAAPLTTAAMDAIAAPPRAVVAPCPAGPHPARPPTGWRPGAHRRVTYKHGVADVRNSRRWKSR